MEGNVQRSYHCGIISGKLRRGGEVGKLPRKPSKNTTVYTINYLIKGNIVCWVRWGEQGGGSRLFYVTLLTVRNKSKLSFRDTATSSATCHNSN